MGKIIREHTMKYFLNNKLFTNKQFGFLNGRSTSLQLLNVLDQWTKYLDEGRSVDCIYMGPPKGGSGAMCYVQKSLACYVLCNFLFTLLCEIQIGCYAEVQPVLCDM